MLNSLKDFLLQPAPLLVKLSETAKKPTAANIVMTVSSDTSVKCLTMGQSSGWKKDAEDSPYHKVRRVALDSICRCAKITRSVQ